MHYDPMIAKLALQAGTRDDCIERALAALRDYAVLGVTTNVAYLLSILDHPAFRAGETHTGFLPEHLAGWAPAGGGVPEEDPELTAALVAAAVVESGNGGPRRAAGEGGHERAADAPSPWETLGRFRLGGLD
jgi:acetyl/propionyl-CoA carboxylase alpha subunit